MGTVDNIQAVIDLRVRQLEARVRDIAVSKHRIRKKLRTTRGRVLALTDVVEGPRGRT